MKKPRILASEQAERDRLWRETLERQNRNRAFPLQPPPESVMQRELDERFRKLERTSKAFWCAEPTESGTCEGELRIAFREGKYILICSAGHVSPPVERRPPLYELWKQGKVAVPVFIVNQFQKRLEKEREK